MLDKNAHQWQSIEMIPVIQDRVSQAINASKNAQEQLNSNSPHLMAHVLWGDEQCLQDHECQIEQLILLRQQCEFWRNNNYLTPRQKIELLHLESCIVKCEKISQHISFILHEKLK